VSVPINLLRFQGATATSCAAGSVAATDEATLLNVAEHSIFIWSDYI
jgi:hypothetical protein